MTFIACVYSFILLDSLTPLTYWMSKYVNGAWMPPTKVFDSSPVAANATYLQSAGFTKDGTHLGITLSHSIAAVPPDATTLDFLGDGLPAAPVDASSGNTLSAPWAQLSGGIQNPYGAWFFNGAYYMIAVDSSGSSAIRILTSPTGTNPWMEVDAAHHPILNAGSPAPSSNATYRCTVTVPSKIDFFFSTPGNTQCFLQTFDLLTKAWGAPYGLLGPLFGTQFNPRDIVRFPNGDLAGISLVQTFGGALHWSYRIFSGANWGAEIMLPIAAPQTFSGTIIDPGVPDTMLIWRSNNFPSHTDSFSYFTATHAGAVSPVLFTTRATIDDFAAGGFGHGISAQGIQYVPITDTSSTTESVWIGSGANLVETFLPIPPGDQGIGPEVAGFMIDWSGAAPSLWLPQYKKALR